MPNFTLRQSRKTSRLPKANTSHRAKARYFTESPRAARRRANDVRFADDVCLRAREGKHLIIDRKAIYIISERSEDTLSDAKGGVVDFCIQA